MEFDILHLLARHPGQVFSARQIYESVASDSAESSWAGIGNMVYKLRRKIGSEAIRGLLYLKHMIFRISSVNFSKANTSPFSIQALTSYLKLLGVPIRRFICRIQSPANFALSTPTKRVTTIV